MSVLRSIISGDSTPASVARAWALEVSAAVARTGGGVTRKRDDSWVAIDSPECQRTVRTWIYQDVHLRCAPSIAETASLSSDVVAGLGQHWWSQGWKRVGSSGSQQLVENGRGVTLVVPSDAVDSDTTGGVSVRLPRLRANVSPGWHGVTSLRGPASGQLARIYLASWPSSQFIALIRAMDDLPDRWTAKWATDPAAARPDSAVLYLPPLSIRRVLPIVGDQDRGAVRSIPGFSVRRGPGVALGGSVAPGRSASFGTLVADAAATAVLRGVSVAEGTQGFAADLLELWS